MVTLFLVFLRDCHATFHSCCTNLHSHQQFRSVPFPLQPHQHLLWFVLFMTAILTGVRWNLKVVLFFISYMATNVGHFFICLLTICSSFENCLFSSLAHLFSEFLILQEVSFLSSLYILVINPLSDV
jgi:hypothetical protein